MISEEIASRRSFARVVVVELPIGNRAVGRGLPAHLDQPAGAEVRPRHLLFARPVALHRLAERPGDARRPPRPAAAGPPAGGEAPPRLLFSRPPVPLPRLPDRGGAGRRLQRRVAVVLATVA